MNGYALTIDGSPIVAVTPGATPSSWLPATDAPTGATRLEALATPAVEWQERCRVADGDLDVDGVTFALHDLPGLTGLAEGQPWLTYLTTRPADDVPRAVLAASFTAADTTFTLSDYGLIASSFPCVLWIDDEAINCASILAGVVTVASGGRGYYGTRARAHTIDEELGVIPEAWAAPVWLQRRRVLLWRVEGTTASVIWRGYANRPRLAPDGASWQLQCEPAWTVDRAHPLGIPTAGTRVRGYSPRAVSFAALTGSTAATFGAGTYLDAGGLAEDLVFRSLDELLSWAKPKLHARLAALAGVTSAIVDLRRTRSQVTLSLQTSDLTATPLTAQIRIAGKITAGSPSSGNPQKSSVVEEMPGAAVLLKLAYDEASPPHIPVTSTSGLAFPAATPLENGPHVTTVQTVLIGDAGDGLSLVLYPTATSDDDADVGGGPSVTAGFRYYDGVTGRVVDLREQYRGTAYGEYAKILSATRLQLGARITTTHWAYGLAALLADDTHVRAGFDPRNFDTDSLATVATLTESEVSGREWNLDGSKTLGDLLVPTLAAEGCVPAIVEYGRVGFVALRNPISNEPDAATFSAATDFVAGTRVEYEDSPAGVVNVAKIEVGRDKITLRDVRSIGRYGQGKVASFALSGLDYAGDLTDARMVSSRLLSRVVQVLGDPVAMLRWTTHLGFFNTYAGSVVSLTDATAPNGAGGRGNSARRCQITARRVSLASGRVVFDALALPETYAYSPAARVAAISGDTLTLDYQYVLEGGADATDYAGTTTGSSGDRGARKYAVGDCLKLVLRDSTTYEYLSVVVASIGTGVNLGKITLTAVVSTSPIDWVTEAAAGRVDVIYDDVDTAGLQAAQLEYAWGGSGSSVFGSIGSTGLQSRRWGA